MYYARSRSPSSVHLLVWLLWPVGLITTLFLDHWMSAFWCSDARSGSKGSIYGGLAGAALMGAVSGPRMFSRFPNYRIFRLFRLEESTLQISRLYIECLVIMPWFLLQQLFWVSYDSVLRPNCRQDFAFWFWVGWKHWSLKSSVGPECCSSPR
jgi:hypothetical protein